jgi:DNA-binding CsgD family transcriptional regulator
MNTKLTAAELQDRYVKMYELYMEGKSYRELGALFKISAERVRQILHTRSSEHDLVELRRRITNRCMNTWRAKEICNLLDAGNSCRKVAEILNISIDAVKRVSARHKRNKPVRLTPELKSS